MKDLELGCLLSITRRLPRVRGAGVVGHALARFYRRKPRPAVTAEVYGSQMELDPNECVDAELLFYPQLYDRREVEFIRANLSAGETFVDVGAHIGFYSLMASRQVGHDGRVVAIEADPSSYRRLLSNLERNRLANVQPINIGASDRDERIPLFVNSSGNRGGSTMLAEPARAGGGIEVPCLPLLSLLQQAGIESVAGMKLDIEGMEFRVLRRFLAEAPPALVARFLVVEYQGAWVERAGGDVVALLEGRGYSTIRRTRMNHLMVQAGRPTVRY